MDSDLTRDIIKKERHHKTRSNVLLSSGKVCVHSIMVCITGAMHCRRLITLWNY